MPLPSLSTPIGNTGVSIDPSKAARTALLVAKNTGRLHFDAGGNALKQAISNFSQDRNAEFGGKPAGSSPDGKLLQAMLWQQQHQLAVAEPQRYQPQQPMAQNMGDLGDEIERGAKFLKGEPADDDERGSQPDKETVISAATGHQSGSAPPVVSGVHVRGVQNGNAPPLITTKSYGTPAGPASMRGGPSSPNPDYHYAALNNPGNIGFGDWAQKHGAVTHAGWDTGHAIAGFPDLDTGYRAMATLASNKYNGGAVSLNDLIAGRNGWTPGNKIAASNIAKYMGISPQDDLNLNDPSSMANFQRALTMQETGSSAQWDAYNAPRNPPQRAAQEQPESLREPPASVPAVQSSPLPPSQSNSAPLGPEAQAQPMTDQSNLYDKIAFSPDVQAGYDNPQVLFDPNAAPAAARGGKIRRAGGGPAYASMPTNELIDRALRLINRRKAADGGAQTPTLQSLQAQYNTLQNQEAKQQAQQAAVDQQLRMQATNQMMNIEGNGGRGGIEPAIDAPESMLAAAMGPGTPQTGPTTAPPTDNTPNKPVVPNGEVGNKGTPGGGGIDNPPTTGPSSYDPGNPSVTGPTSPIPMANPNAFNGYNYNNSLDQVLGTNNPTQDQIFGFNYPQNLPAPKQQPVGPVSQDEINGLYGFGGGYQMGTGTFNSGGAVLMDALNRARKNRDSGGKLQYLLKNLPDLGVPPQRFYDDDSKLPQDYRPIGPDSQVQGYDHLFNNPPQPDANWSTRDSDYRSYPSTNEQAIRRGGAVKGKR